MSELAPDPALLAALLGGAQGAPADPALAQEPREPGSLEEEEDENPIDLIAEMIDIAQDFLDREDVPEQGKRIMEDVTTKLRQITSTEEKLSQSTPGSLVSNASA